MPTLFWLEIASLSICTVTATVLGLMALTSGVKRGINRSFVLFTLMEAVWAACSLLLRITLLIEKGNPSLLLEMVTLTSMLMPPFLLMFTVRYVQRPTRQADIAALLGIASLGLLSIPLFDHRIILNPSLDLSTGVTWVQLSNWGFATVLLPVPYMVWSLVLFWQERGQTKEPYLALSVLVLLIGFVAGGISKAPLPISVILYTCSICTLGYAVISRQLFNPLQELTGELKQRVEDRTQELADATLQLSAIHTLGQRLVLSRDAREIAELVLEAAQRVFCVSTCGLWLVDENEQTLIRLAHSTGPGTSDVSPLALDGEQGIITSAVRSGETIYLSDVSQNPRFIDGGFHSRSESSTPLRVGDRIIGVLNVESPNLNGFDPSDIQLIEALSSSAAIAIHNARLHEETRRRADRLEVVNHIVSATGATLNLNGLMEMVYLEIVPTFHPDAFFIALYIEETDELDLCFTVDEGMRHPPERFPLGTGLTSLVVNEGKPLLIRDMEKEKGRLPPQVPMGTGRSAVSWLGVPMLVGERLIGVINVQAYRANAWAEEDQLLLSTIADQVAIALERARLFEDRERRVIELAIVNDIGRSVSSILDMGDLLAAVHRQASRLLDTTNFHIATYEENSKEWRIVLYIEDGQPQSIDLRQPLASGLTGHVIQHRQRLLLRSSEEILAFERANGIESVGQLARSWLGVPLIAADNVVGMMGIQSYEQDNVYTEQDLNLFSTIAAQVAPALDNLRLLEETRRRAEEMEAINEVGQAITSVLDLDGILRRIVDTAKARFGHYFIGIAMLEEDLLVYRSGSTVGHSNQRFERGHLSLSMALTHESSLVAQAGRTGQPVLVNDVLKEPRFLPIEELPDTRSELSIPIKAKGRVIGVMDVQSDGPFTFSETDVALLGSLANQAGAAIDNARLFEEARIRAEELAVLNELGQTLTARLDVEQVLEEAYRGASRLLDAVNFSIALHDPETGEVTFAIDVTEGTVRKFLNTQRSSDGLTEYIIRNRAPLLIQQNLPQRMEELRIEGIGRTSLCWLGVPLVIGDGVLGVMAVESYTRPCMFDEHAQDLLTAIASQTAIAIHNARLYEAVQQELMERRLAEEALRASIETFGTVLDSVDADVYAADMDSYEILFMNKHMQGSFGSDLTGRICWDVFREESGPCSHCTNDRLLDADGNPTGACVWEGKNPLTKTWYINYDRAVRWVDGRIVRLQIATDITSIKQAEETLRRQKEYLDGLHEMTLGVISRLELNDLLEAIVARAANLVEAPDGFIYLCDPDQGGLEMRVGLGAPKKAVGLRIGLGEGVAGRVAETGQTLVVKNYSTWAGRVADSRFDGARSVVGIPLKSGSHVIGVIGLDYQDSTRSFTEEEIAVLSRFAELASIALDNAQLYATLQAELAERERAQEALRESETRYRTVIEHQTDLICGFLPDGTLTFVNQTYCHYYGRQREELIGQSFIPFIVPEDQAGVSSHLASFSPQKPVATLEYRVVVADGKVRWQQWINRPVFDEDGHLIEFQSVGRDVTDRKYAEERQQRYADELERSNEEVKQFAYIVSHDLRAPLVNMKGFASELRLALNEIQSVIDDVWPHLTEQQHQTLTYALREDAPEALQFIDSSVNRMDSFIAALLKLSRLGRRELEREPVDVEHVVQNILPTLAHQITAHQGKVTIAPLPQVIADRTSIEQIMGNILGNAVKYLAPDRPARIEITAERNANETIFHIRDNGRGVAPGDMDKVFTPFRRAGIQDVPGEGMGLAYVQTLVRRHSGRIWCVSEPDVGSTFSFTIPDNLDTNVRR